MTRKTYRKKYRITPITQSIKSLERAVYVAENTADFNDMEISKEFDSLSELKAYIRGLKKATELMRELN